MVDFKIDSSGDNQMMLTCPVCEWEGVVYYARKQPVYCSNACKQKAARQRRKAAKEDAIVHGLIKDAFRLYRLSDAQMTRLASYVQRAADYENDIAYDKRHTPEDAIIHSAVWCILSDVASYVERFKNERNNVS